MTLFPYFPLQIELTTETECPFVMDSIPTEIKLFDMYASYFSGRLDSCPS